MQAKYIVGPRSMSKINMKLEDIFWNSIPGLRPQGLQAVEAILLRAESIWAINLCFFVKGRIQFWQVMWLEGDRNLAIITKTRFRFAESLAPQAKGSLRSPFASGGLSRFQRSRFALDFSRASGARIWVNCLESSLSQGLVLLGTAFSSLKPLAYPGFHATGVQGCNVRGIFFRGGQSHSSFFPSMKYCFPVENSHFGRPSPSRWTSAANEKHEHERAMFLVRYSGLLWGHLNGLS